MSEEHFKALEELLSNRNNGHSLVNFVIKIIIFTIKI